ncbi:MAG: helix-turn-helix domain-containing protein [Wujia sp.]
MISCRDILNLKLDGVELIAGESGLNRMVSWTYLCQTKPYSEHMNQGNFALVVIDYVRFNIEQAYETMLELYELGISGYAISIVDDREKVPQYFIDKANELELPFFYVRWEGAPFVDIDQSIGNLILESENQSKKTGDYLYNLLFGYDVNSKYVEKISGQFGLDFSVPHRVGIIVVDRKYGNNLEQDEHLYEYYANTLNREVLEMEDKPMFMRFLNKFVLLFEATKEKKTEHEIEKMLRYIDGQPAFKDKIRATCILGGTYSNPSDYGRSYQEAKSLIPKKNILPNPKGKKVLSASAMGIYKFMFNSGNQTEIMSYCEEKLHKLDEYDRANGTYLQDTLVAYYMNGFNTTKTAEALFIHRNSLQYRLSKIEDLLEIELDDYMEYLDLVNCILVKRLMFN